MKKRVSVVLLMVGLFAVSIMAKAWAVVPVPADLPPTVKEMVAKATSAVKTAPAGGLKAVVEKKGKAIILDVRDANEFAAGHVPGAINLSRGVLEFLGHKTLQDKNTNILVYCRTGLRATMAAKTLNDMGYKGATLADIHFEEWVKAGNSVER